MPRVFPALLLAATLLAPAAFAQSPVPEKIVTLDVCGSDLHAVVNLLHHETGAEILVRDGKTPYRLVYAHLQNAALAQALRAVATSAGAQVAVNRNGVYLLAPQGAAAPAVEMPHQPPMRPTPINPADLRWRKIELRRISPDYVLALMHWAPQGNAGDRPQLPNGVAQILALHSSGFLIVNATDSGYEALKNIVKILDVAPVPVAVSVQFVSLPAGQKEVINLREADRAALQLYESGATFYPKVTVQTRNGTPAEVPLETRCFRPFVPDNAGGSFLTTLPIFSLTPLIQADNSVAVRLSYQKSLLALHTVPKGRLTIFDLTGLPEVSPLRVLMLVTPAF